MRRFLTAAAALSLLVGAPTTMADHNSVWGEGFANMPNDIHNLRLETDDNMAFRDLIKGGAGADTINRCIDPEFVDVDGECYDGELPPNVRPQPGN